MQPFQKCTGSYNLKKNKPKYTNNRGATMRGSVVNQVYTVFNAIIQFGGSKHEAKLEYLEKNQSATKEQIADNTGIYSYLTADQYRATGRECFQYLKETENLKDITKITGEQIQKFLEHKVADDNISHKTFQTTAGALNKLATALNAYTETNNYNFRDNIKNIENTGYITEHVNRAYLNPEKVINNLTTEACKIVATLQNEYGLRLHEASNIRLSQIDENNILRTTGKGGYPIEKQLSEKIVLNIKNNAVEGRFSVSSRKYTNEIKNACKTLKNEKYNGSHGFRYNFAQKTFKELIKNNNLENTAKLAVSKELGHHRSDITDHYLSK